MHNLENLGPKFCSKVGSLALEFWVVKRGEGVQSERWLTVPCRKGKKYRFSSDVHFECPLNNFWKIDLASICQEKETWQHLTTTIIIFEVCQCIFGNKTNKNHTQEGVYSSTRIPLIIYICFLTIFLYLNNPLWA